VSNVGYDAKPWAAVQFKLVREGATWLVEPVPGTVNDTLVNGRRIERRTVLKAGDTLAVGNAAKGVAVTPFKIRLE
jgi:hypothetical protein